MTTSTRGVIREFEFEVEFTEEAAEPDVGYNATVGIRSVRFNGVEVALTQEQLDSIRDELVEDVFYSSYS